MHYFGVNSCETVFKAMGNSIHLPYLLKETVPLVL